MWCRPEYMRGKKLPPHRTRLLDRSASVSRGARELTTQSQSASDVQNIHRPADQNHFTKLNANKMYGASNVVPHPNAGYKNTDCAFKNLTTNSKDDPIVNVASMFPNTKSHSKFLNNTDLDSFPVGSTFPMAMRSVYQNCQDVSRQKVSERAGMTSRLGMASLLRPWAQSFQIRQQQVKNYQQEHGVNVNMMFNAGSDFYNAIGA